MRTRLNSEAPRKVIVPCGMIHHGKGFSLLLSRIKLIFCPRNRSGSNVSHTGLIVSAQSTARVLRMHGVNAYVRAVGNRDDIEALIASDSPTHIVINALWLPTAELFYLVQTYVHVHFAVLCHSNIAFLQAEPNAINLLHEAVDLELSSLGNFQVAANSRNGAAGIRHAWECPAFYLPNLYYLDDTARVLRRRWNGGTLRIGSFGAMRPLKNPTASAFASLAIATALSTDLEYFVNGGRDDGGWASRLLPAVQAIFKGVKYAKLNVINWERWPDFRRTVRGMHLLLQPSFTETFNIVTADGVAEGIPSVVSDVIEWAPEHWRAHPDNTQDIARVGRHLAQDEHAAHEGLEALRRHDIAGAQAWTTWLLASLEL